MNVTRTRSPSTWSGRTEAAHRKSIGQVRCGHGHGAVAESGQQAGQAQLLPSVESIVRRGTVRAQGNVDTSLQIGGNRRRA